MPMPAYREIQKLWQRQRGNMQTRPRHLVHAPGAGAVGVQLGEFLHKTECKVFETSKSKSSNCNLPMAK